MIRSVAVIGAGAMGAAMARHIRAAGFDLTVCDRNEQALAAFAGPGVKVTGVPGRCAAADLIVVIVGTPAQVLDVALGKDGLVTQARAGHRPIVAVMGTVSPHLIRRLHDELSPKGFRVVDAPVSGGPLRAERGTLTIMVAGDNADIDAATPVLRCMGPNVIRCGARGRAQALKLINNLVGITSLVVAGEAYRLADRLGLSLAETAAVLEAGTGRNFYSQSPADAAAAYEAYARSPDGFANLLGLMRKDIDLAVEMAAGVDGAFPGARGIKAIIDAIGEETRDTWLTVAGMHEAEKQ